MPTDLSTSASAIFVLARPPARVSHPSEIDLPVLPDMARQEHDAPDLS